MSACPSLGCQYYFIICGMVWYRVTLIRIINHPKQILSKELLAINNQRHQVEPFDVYITETLFFLFFLKRFRVFGVNISIHALTKTQLIMMFYCLFCIFNTTTTKYMT